MDKRKLSLKKIDNKEINTTQENTESDTEIVTEIMEMSQKMKEETNEPEHTFKIIPIDFIFERIEGDEIKGEEMISEYSGKIEKILEQRNYIANLLRDLRKYEGDNLPIYARITTATFAPKFGSEEASSFFKEKMTTFTKTMRQTFRTSMIESPKELFDYFTAEMQKLWSEATEKIDMKRPGGHTTLRKFNEKIQRLQEKWAKKYRNNGLDNHNENKEIDRLKKEIKELKETNSSRRSSKETNTIGDIKRELDELKERIEDKGNRYERKEFRGGRGGRRGRRYDF
ncbi:Hypothetical predicted protein [Mytilus galloprovincialis]|uniref:Uncharacterized protein n=1 Tax=Mytilus galloprovincialis TaxID=29158 RepID=A0A8B6H3X0_MYTGA|nr:Hypothetical predicted protein [Mytilus galloprovincialis]